MTEIKISKPIVPDSEIISKHPIGQRGKDALEEMDLNLLQKALELRGYIVFKDRMEYLKSVETLRKGIEDA